MAKLDQRLPAQHGGGKVHVRYLEFADAEATANVLNNISQGAATPGRPAGTPAGGTGVNPVAASLFEGTIKISPDKATNALVINASPGDFETIQRVLNQLDRPRDEVYVEVIIMEISMEKQFAFSANIANPPSGLGSLPQGTDLQNAILNPLSAAGAVLGFKAGNSYSFTPPGQTVPVTVSSLTGLIQALQTNSKSNILATPQIIALDNSEATFEQEEDIPILNSSVASTGVTSNSVGKQPVTLSIKIKPQINKMSNFVKLDITSKLGNIEQRVLPAAVQNQAFATLQRTAQTTVVVGDSDTIVLGGLIHDTVQETHKKVPLLGDIPILGWLFSARTSDVTKSNLLIFMTPHIVRQYDKVRTVLDRKLQERDDFIEKNMGGEDLDRASRDKIIRSLPDIKQLMNSRPQNTVLIDPEENPAAGSGVGSGGGGANVPPPATVPAGNSAPGIAAPGQNR